jgi:hypothetical protein
LNGSSFTINSLSNIKRPTTIDLSRNPNLKFINETIFLPLFESNPENKIYISSSNLDCDDCRSHWLVKEPKYLERFHEIKCSNGNDMRNSNNFKNCK